MVRFFKHKNLKGKKNKFRKCLQKLLFFIYLKAIFLQGIFSYMTKYDNKRLSNIK